MTLPGLGEVQVETAILSQQNNETKLYKIDEKRMGGFGEDIEARGGETKANEGQGSSEHGAEPKDKDKKKKQMPQEDLYVIVLAGRATTATSTSENGTGNFSSRRGASINEKKVHGTDSGWIGRRVRPRSNSFSQARSSEAAQLLSVKAFRPDIEKGVGKNSREAGGDSSRKKKPLSRRRTTLLNYVNWGSNPDNGKYPVHPVDLEGLQETAV